MCLFCLVSRPNICFSSRFFITDTTASATPTMPDLFQDSSDDESFCAASDDGGDDGSISTNEEIDDNEAQDLKRDAKTPMRTKTPVRFCLSAQQSTGLEYSMGHVFLGRQQKMVAVVQGNSPPCATIHSIWKDDCRQERVTIATLIPSGTRAEDIKPSISGGTKIHMEKSSTRIFLLYPRS